MLRMPIYKNSSHFSTFAVNNDKKRSWFYQIWELLRKTDQVSFIVVVNGKHRKMSGVFINRCLLTCWAAFLSFWNSKLMYLGRVVRYCHLKLVLTSTYTKKNASFSTLCEHVHSTGKNILNFKKLKWMQNVIIWHILQFSARFSI